jgi:MoxR-like ATPase
VTAQATAYLAGRDFVTPDDVKTVATPLLRHRLLLKPEALLDGLQIDAAIASILNKVPVPR